MAGENDKKGLVRVRSYQKTDVGRVRKHNEDSSYADPKGRFFVVADGMGGHAAGEVASQLAVEEVKRLLEAEMGKLTDGGASGLSAASISELMSRLAKRANKTVRDRASQDPSTRGMGTTLEVLLLAGNAAWVGHVGDSRCYLIRGPSVSQLTFDQTISEQLTGEQKRALGVTAKRLENVLTEAIGAKEEVNAAVAYSDLKPGDVLLLCSDGLYQYFTRADEIGEVLAMDGCEKGLDRLIQLALERGGRDNVTAVVVEIVELAPGVKPIRGPTPARPGTATAKKPPAPEPYVSAADQNYGIEEAILLLRKLPNEKPDVVLRVMKNTLASAGVRLPPIISDATEKQERLSERVKQLNDAISELSREVEARQKEIASLESDLAETIEVRERFEMVMRSS